MRTTAPNGMALLNPRAWLVHASVNLPCEESFDALLPEAHDCHTIRKRCNDFVIHNDCASSASSACSRPLLVHSAAQHAPSSPMRLSQNYNDAGSHVSGCIRAATHVSWTVPQWMLFSRACPTCGLSRLCPASLFPFSSCRDKLLLPAASWHAWCWQQACRC